MKKSVRFHGFLVAGALAVAGSTLSAPAAHADPTQFSDVAVVQGCVNTTPVQVNIPPIPPNPQPGTFSGPVTCAIPVPTTCVISSDGENGLPTEGPEFCTVSNISGSYNNLVCGTGDAQGQVTIDSANEHYVITFQITFVAGQGVFTGTSQAETSPPEPGDRFIGVVSITPTAPLVPPCPVTQFLFTAAVYGYELP